MLRRAVLAAVIGGVLILGCISSNPPPPQVRIVEAGMCWYEVKHCSGERQLTATVFAEDCTFRWEARCREDELERYTRKDKDGHSRCTLVRLADPSQIAVACKEQG